MGVSRMQRTNTKTRKAMQEWKKGRLIKEYYQKERKAYKVLYKIKRKIVVETENCEISKIKKQAKVWQQQLLKQLDEKNRMSCRS